MLEAVCETSLQMFLKLQERADSELFQGGGVLITPLKMDLKSSDQVKHNLMAFFNSFPRVLRHFFIFGKIRLKDPFRLTRLT